MYIQNEHRSPLWPPLTAHRIFWETRNNPHVYEYDPTDEGPEVEIIQRHDLRELIEAAL